MCCVAALNKLRLAMMAMMAMRTMTMKMITKTAIEDNSAQRRQPCCGGGGGDNDGCSYVLLLCANEYDAWCALDQMKLVG